ncbi:MAG: hypothetical protein GXY92_10980 [Syntrophomonadaceae bacterium]|nr:hypothetical protein [Syntrophomonadaceae bacterium]
MRWSKFWQALMLQLVVIGVPAYVIIMSEPYSKPVVFFAIAVYFIINAVSYGVAKKSDEGYLVLIPGEGSVLSILNSSYDNRTINIAGICAALLLGLALIGFVIDVRWDMRHIQGISPRLFSLMGKSALAGLLWGLMLEYKNLARVFINKPAVNWLVIPTIALLFLTFWPWAAGFFYDPSNPHTHLVSFNPRNDPGAHMMISIASGVLLVRSLQKPKVNQD